MNCAAPSWQKPQQHKTNNNLAAAWLETINMLKAAELVIAAALQRRESRGSHWRLDYNTPDETLANRHYVFQPMHHTQPPRRSGSGEDVERGWLHSPGAWLAEDGLEEVPSHA